MATFISTVNMVPRYILLFLIFVAGCDSPAPNQSPADSAETKKSGQQFEGILTKDAHAHTKLSMLHGNYHIEPDDTKLELLPQGDITDEVFESLVGKRIVVTGKLITGRSIKTTDPNEEGLQRPSEIMGEKIPLGDAIEVKTIRAVEQE